MKTEQIIWKEAVGWNAKPEMTNARLVLCFGGVDVIHLPEVYNQLKAWYPEARIVLSSTAGEIAGSGVFDNTVIANALIFEHTEVKVLGLDLSDFKDSRDCGEFITGQMTGPNLCHILILSDGSMVNGDSLISGLNEKLPQGVVVTGGLAADAGRFSKTFVGIDEVPKSGRIAAIAFYGSSLIVGHGSQGGWDEFGPVRKVTSSEGNILYSLDHVPALDIYKKYLGDKAEGLPGAALLFPLCILHDDGTMLVRTILSIREDDGAMVFAGDIPQGSQVQFMMANFDRLIDGAHEAASQSASQGLVDKPEFVLMISCVGRKLVLGSRIEEEVESVTALFGPSPTYSGFYSNGEISPLLDSAICSLHNQTMTITTYLERNNASAS
jgi:hypothetical protein